MTPRPPALETAAARGPPDVRAMPARMMGYWMPRSWERGVWREGGAIVVILLPWLGDVVSRSLVGHQWMSKGGERRHVGIWGRMLNSGEGCQGFLLNAGMEGIVAEPRHL